MGILQSLFGDSSPPEQYQQDQEDTINLSEDEYDVVYPIQVRRSELTAFKNAIQADRDTPHVEGGLYKFEKEIRNEVWKDFDPDDMTLEEALEKHRQQAEQIIDAWADDLEGDQDIIFLPVGVDYELHGMLAICEKRAEREDDPFELPNDFLEAANLLKRVREADLEDSEPAVFAHVDDIPFKPAHYQ